MLIIDCNNLWYAAMVLGEPLNGVARHDLVRLLEAYSRRAGEPMMIVLDGFSPGKAPRAATDRTCPAQLQYAGNRSADEVIREVVEQSSEPRRLTVVSSDRSLVREVRKRRAKVVDSAVFARRLMAWLNRPAQSASAEPAGKHTGLGGSLQSIGDWLKFFQLTDEKSDIIAGERAGMRKGGQAERSTSPSGSSPDAEVTESQSDSQMRRVFDGVQPLRRRKTKRARPPRRTP